LRVAEGPFVLNVAEANAFEWRRTVNGPGTPVDRTEWAITVPTVTANNDRPKNEMAFPPAAWIQQPSDGTAEAGQKNGSLVGVGGGADRGLHVRATLLHRLRTELARARPARAAPHARHGGPPRPRAVADQWAALEHRGVRAGVWLYGRGPDGSAEGEGA